MEAFPDLSWTSSRFSSLPRCGLVHSRQLPKKYQTSLWFGGLIIPGFSSNSVEKPLPLKTGPTELSKLVPSDPCSWPRARAHNMQQVFPCHGNTTLTGVQLSLTTRNRSTAKVQEDTQTSKGSSTPAASVCRGFLLTSSPPTFPLQPLPFSPSH